jgi:hypothetical protein
VSSLSPLLSLLLSLRFQVCKLVIDAARAVGKRVVLVRHPMPYGDLAKQVSPCDVVD